jgi:N-dimethylarginine dimethylaminohydrolase
MSPPPVALTEVGVVTEFLVKHAKEAFVSEQAAAAEWRALGFTAAPDVGRAIEEYDQFIEAITAAGASLRRLPAAKGTGLDSIYVRDASVVCASGVVLCSMGKAQRAWEPAAQGSALRGWGIPVAGEIRKPGRLEGGDVVWLNGRTVVVGRGYRTNDDGIRQFTALVGSKVEVVVAQLPHWRGAGDVFHLMSVLSPVDHDLAVVYSPLMPVPLRERLVERGMQLVEVPDEEFTSMGANVLAIAPRECVMVAGSPRTRALLERAGAAVQVYPGAEISLKGGGGPTCLTRPLSRR